MTNVSFAKFFDMPTIDKFFVGYEPMIKRMEEAHAALSKAIPNYPPYNIVKVDENKYVIEMAVAGFGKHNLDLEFQDGTLVISGNSQLSDMYDEGENNQYLYKGIADRSFTRKFSLADTVEIKGADLVNGMLKIWLENIIPESKKPKKVEIKDPTSSEPVKASKKQLLTEKNKED
jgi:molecular chaperone IbpA